MATILTALRGNRALSERWAASVGAVKNADGAIAAVNNDEDAAIVKAMGGSVIRVAPFGGGDEEARVKYIASVYEALIRAAASQWVILWDDDMLPPPSGIERLIKAARKVATDSVGVATVYPYANDKEGLYMNLFWRPYSSAAHITTIPPEGLHQVWGGGTGFSIWKRATLIETLPWSLPAGSIQGWDWDLAIKLEEKGLRVMAECSIRSRHDTLP